jgi:fluoride exporter
MRRRNEEAVERSIGAEATPGVRWHATYPPLPYLVAVAAGGAIGAVARHLFVLAFPHDAGAFPAVTFAENVVGAFLLGVVLVALLRSPLLSMRWRPFMATGVLGSFTTFSNVSVQILELMAEGRAGTAALYVLASLAVGLGAAAAGIALGARIMRRWRP